MNTIAIRHPGVTVAYRTSVFNTKRREVMKQIKFFLNKRRFKQRVRRMFTTSIKETSGGRFVANQLSMRNDHPSRRLMAS